MKITEDQEFRAALLKKIEDREFSERTGVHCSDLVYCLNKQAMRRLHPKKSEDHETLLFSLGWATQRWLTGQDEDEESIEVDGILVTQDSRWETGETKEVAVLPTGQTLIGPPIVVKLTAPWELKATFQSSTKNVSENTAWFRQMMAQCKVTGTTMAYLSRLEIMGNWKSISGKKDEKALPENQKPTLHAYRIEFTQEEIDKNWAWLIERRDQFQALLDGAPLMPKLTALAPGMAWLCQYCEYNCGGVNDSTKFDS